VLDGRGMRETMMDGGCNFWIQTRMVNGEIFVAVAVAEVYQLGLGQG
jgi:hypothetical protein